MHYSDIRPAALMVAELTGAGRSTQAIMIAGSVIMILGAISTGSAVAPGQRATFLRGSVCPRVPGSRVSSWLVLGTSEAPGSLEGT